MSGSQKFDSCNYKNSCLTFNRSFVAGLGLSNNGQKQSSVLYLPATFPCQKWYNNVTQDKFCAKGIVGDVCAADMGGPIFTEKRLPDSTKVYTLSGIRTNPFCRGVEKSEIFTLIWPHIGWIEWDFHSNETLLNLDLRLRVIL